MRNHTITIAKAIAIIFMVAGHAGAYHILCVHNLQSFWLMPLFFFCSGFCFKDKYLTEPFAFIKKRFKGLWWPYVKWSLLFLAFHNVFFDWHIYSPDYDCYGEILHIFNFKEFVYVATKIITTMTCHDPMLGGFWFVHTLFYASIFSFLIIKYLGGGKKPILCVVVLTLITSYFNLRVPILDIKPRELMATSFFLIGYSFQQRGLDIKKKYLVIMFLALIFVAQFWSSSVLYFSWKDVVPYILCAICGTLLIINISKKIKAQDNIVSRFLIFVGTHTFQVLTWHFLCFRMVTLFVILFSNRTIEQLATHPTIPIPGMWIIYTIVGVIVPIFFVWICEKCSILLIKK